MKKIDEIRETVQEAYDIMCELNCNLYGLYNYIRYGNEDFGNDMYMNSPIPFTDNSQIQHYYLVFFIKDAIDRNCEIPKEFIQLYLDNKEKYNDEQIAAEIKIIEKKLVK